MRSRISSGAAGWARCTAPATRGSIATSRSKCCPRPCRPTRIACGASSRKRAEPPALAGCQTLLATRKVDTLPGAIVGTVGYMSPEQVRAKPVDHRSDIFSYGAILYEMLSGERAFKGDTPADAISAVLRGE